MKIDIGLSRVSALAPNSILGRRRVYVRWSPWAIALVVATLTVGCAGSGSPEASSGAPSAAAPVSPTSSTTDNSTTANSTTGKSSEYSPPSVAASPSPAPDDAAQSPQTTALSIDTPLPDYLSAVLDQVKQQSQVPVLLPSSLPDEITSDPIYVTVEGDADYYNLTLGLVPDCTANVCSVGSLSAERGGEAYPDEFSSTVTLANGISGYFSPMACGASCSPPVLSWEYDGAFYRLYLKLGGEDAEVEAQMAAIANSAITAGPR